MTRHTDRRIRALLWLDPGAGELDGEVVQGHIVQAQRTAAALRDLDVVAVVSNNEDEAVEAFDVVHGIGMHRAQIRRARQAGVPVAISPIYWSASYVLDGETTASAAQRLRRRAIRIARITASGIKRGPGTSAMRITRSLMERALDFELADLLLPNSQAEAAAIAEELGVTTPCHVVPNGVDPELFELPCQEHNRDGVLLVARFEPHKNQLGLIKAMRLLPYPLTLVGPPHPEHSGYYEACRREAGDRVTIVQATSHADLRAYYQRARVHVLPSFFETTGLVSLEAALCGCRIASTDRGYASDYFADLASYLEPDDIGSIARAIDHAWHRPDPVALRDRILNRYTWKHVAEATRDGYQQLIREQ